MPSCTVCKQSGHNRRTCTFLKDHFLRVITEELELTDVNSPAYSVIKNYIYSNVNCRLQEAIECEEEAERILIKCNELKRQFEPRHPGLLILDRLITIRDRVTRQREQEEDDEFMFQFETPTIVMPTTPTAALITPTATPSDTYSDMTRDTPFAYENINIVSPITPITPHSVTDLPFSSRLFSDEELEQELPEEVQEEEERQEEGQGQQLEFSFDLDYIPFNQEETETSISSIEVSSPEVSFEYVPAPRRYKRGYEYAKEINVDLRNVSDEDLFGEVKECELCYDRNCSVKTGCGHDFCSVCVRKIVHEKKDTTVAPSCAFCRKAFEKFTTNSPFTYAILCDYIEHMII